MRIIFSRQVTVVGTSSQVVEACDRISELLESRGGVRSATSKGTQKQRGAGGTSMSSMMKISGEAE